MSSAHKMRRSSIVSKDEDKPTPEIAASEVVPVRESKPEPVQTAALTSKVETMEIETENQEPGTSISQVVESEKSKSGNGEKSAASRQEVTETEENKPTPRRGRPRKSVAAWTPCETAKSVTVSDNQDDEEMDVLPEIVKATPSGRGRKSLAAAVFENVGTEEAQATPSRRGRKSLASTSEQESSEPETSTAASRRGRRSLAVETLSTIEAKISTPSRRGRKSIAAAASVQFDVEASSSVTPTGFARTSKITFEEKTIVVTPSADERVPKSGAKRRGRKSNLILLDTPDNDLPTTSSKMSTLFDSTIGGINSELRTPVRPAPMVPTPRRSTRKSMLLTPARK